jgi:hypothetical protein
MGELHKLPGVIAAAGQPRPDVIECLEGLLEEAKSGAIQAIAFAYSDRDGAPVNGWRGENLMTSVSFLFLRYGRDCLADDFEPIETEGER